MTGVQTCALPILFVDSMIEWGKGATSLKEVVGLWKENQSMIEQIKGSNEVQFKRLKDAFAEFKSNFKEEETA